MAGRIFGGEFPGSLWCGSSFHGSARAAGIAAILCCLHGAAPGADGRAYTTWSTMGGTADAANYSVLTQINRSNVDKLQVAWKYDSGDKLAYVFAPIVVDRTLYGVAKNGSLVALDAANGKEIWVHPFPPPAVARRGVG